MSNIQGIEMHKGKLEKAYVSDIDKFLMEFDQSHPKSVSQREEIDKHKRLFLLRDDPNAPREQSAIWEDFYK